MVGTARRTDAAAVVDVWRCMTGSPLGDESRPHQGGSAGDITQCATPVEQIMNTEITNRG
jgi:hypothetical protein